MSRSEHDREFDRLLLRDACGHGDREVWDVFGDFCETAAISTQLLSIHDGERYERGRQIANRHPPAVLEAFVRMLEVVQEALGEDPYGRDFLGEAFMRHELSNKWAGQFFTPMSVSRTVARLTIGDGSIFREKPFVTVQEPACGSGGMVLAFAHEAVAIVPDLVVPEQLHVNAIDVSPVCVHMAMIQLSLSGIAAVICRGNSLSLKMEETWLSPSHVFGGWSKKLDQARGSL